MEVKRSYTGILTEKKELKSGKKNDGTPWVNQEFLIRTDDKYPKTILFVAKAKAVDYLANKKVDDKIEVYFELDSKSTDKGTFTTATALKIV